MMQEERSSCLRELCSLVEDIVGDAFVGDLELSMDTSLIFDLGLESIEIIALLDQLRQRFGYPIERVLNVAESGQSIRDLQVHEVVELMIVQRNTAAPAHAKEVCS